MVKAKGHNGLEAVGSYHIDGLGIFEHVMGRLLENGFFYGTYPKLTQEIGNYANQTR